MLKRLLTFLGGVAVASPSSSATGSNQAEQALLRQIAERSKTDPLIGAKIGSKEITQRLIGTMKTERGVHIESLLSALGSLAGYSCQAALRAQAVARGKPATGLLTAVEARNGETYFFGDHLNRLMAESQYSVWGISGSGAQQAGCARLPDLSDIFKHVASVVGTEAFGVPRIPERNKPQDSPINYVRALWPVLQPLVAKFCPNPEHWPILLSLSIQDVIGMGKSEIDPCLALRLVMESAIPMSKVNLSVR